MRRAWLSLGSELNRGMTKIQLDLPTTDFAEQMSQRERLVCGHTDFRLASSRDGETRYCRLAILGFVTKGFPPDFDSNSEEASDALSSNAKALATYVCSSYCKLYRTYDMY